MEADLVEVELRWEAITEVPEAPQTLMSGIEYSLGNQRKAEEYVNRLLRYLLDPTAPHGMDREPLRAFLETLPESCEFEEDTHCLSKIAVDEQLPITLNETGPD